MFDTSYIYKIRELNHCIGAVLPSTFRTRDRLAGDHREALPAGLLILTSISQMTWGGPHATTSTFWSLLLAEKPTQRLSGDQKGASAFLRLFVLLKTYCRPGGEGITPSIP